MKSLAKLYMERTELAGLVLLIVLAATFQILSDGNFLSYANLRNIASVFPEVALMAIGVTLLMICGEFDLSVGSVFALMPMTMAVSMTSGAPFGLAMVLGFAVCVAIGFINGYISLKFDIPSFITTLGMLFIARSLTVVVSGGFPPLLSADIPTWMFTGFVGPGNFFRMSFLWLTLIAVLASILLSKTNFGNWIKATGGFYDAAASMGIPVNRVKIICFIICSILAGFAGLIQVLRFGSPLPSLGEGMELQAVAAAVIGGTLLRGGIGTVMGGIIGVLLIRVIDNGLVLVGVDANWFKFAIGFLMIFAVVANSWVSAQAKKIKLEVGS